MAATGKYRIIEADTLEARQRHRELLEKELRNPYIPNDLRIELERELFSAIEKENEASYALQREEERLEEEERKKREGEGGDGSEGSEGSGTGSGSSGEGGGMKGEHEDSCDDDISFEEFALLFLLAEQDMFSPAPEVPGQPLEVQNNLEAAEAAATLLLNRDEKLAMVKEPYAIDPELRQTVSESVIPALERHAARMGAQVMQLKVLPNAVDVFKNKYGYEPKGPMVRQRGLRVQRMSKMLSPMPIIPGDA